MMAISRNSVIAGFDRLVDEGYLVTRKGAAPLFASIFRIASLASMNRRHSRKRQWPPLARLILTLPHCCHHGLKEKGVVKCVRFLPSVSAVPISSRMRYGGGCWGASGGNRAVSWGHATAYGYLPLRQAISHYIQATRGVNCHEDRVIIVNGIQQALAIAAQVLLEKGDEVWLDDPGYNGARGAFAARGAMVRPVRVDGEGMDIQDGIRHYPQAKLVYTAPSHQFPLSGTLSLPRRLALLEWAQANRAWIFEDDYNSEFRYAARSLQALQGLDKHQRVIYSGTFSKMMYPEFRLGF